MSLSIANHLSGNSVDASWNVLTSRVRLFCGMFDPPITDVAGIRVRRFARMGKRIIWELDDELFLVIHLMIAGRFYIRRQGSLPKGKSEVAAFQFDEATLMLTEASSKKRASLHLVKGRESLEPFRRDGLDALSCSAEAFKDRLLSENHTVKRALTDPRLFDGIGNAYSDEILHRAQLSPVKWTTRLDDHEHAALFESMRHTMIHWIGLLRDEAAKKGFPEKVTAFRSGMAVHGRFGMPCPVCHTAIQRIRYAENETNYCPLCQNHGKLLADRSLSRLLRGDWPRTAEELEQS